MLSSANPAIGQSWNNPHLYSRAENTAYLPFTNPPKTLDPARAYSADETQLVAQIYEPPLEYHYLKRPYTLVPLSADRMPVAGYFDAHGQKLSDNPNPKLVAYTLYDIFLQHGIFYQPHPAFARDAAGQLVYTHLNREKLKNIHTIADFEYRGTRELTADDFVYEMKRLADPTVQSPIYGLMSQYIVGLSELEKNLEIAHEKIKLSPETSPYIDLKKYSLEGATVIDPYHYQIKIKGFYPQFKFWLAMPFFAPMPWEAVDFYSQAGMAEKNITLNEYPVGTGAYMLIENNPNREIILRKNPNFHDEFYPTEGEPDDLKRGYLENSGKKMPFIDEFVLTLDRESIPRWNKFIQGYYDESGVSADSFDQAIHLNAGGHASVTPFLQKKGIRLSDTINPGIYYMGFNMLDPIVGGYSEAHQKLRRAIAIAIDEEEFISIFLNGRGHPAQGPIPPGIFGYQAGAAGINPWVYVWDNNRAMRRPLSEAQKLLTEAGYPNGRDPKTGKALILNYDLVNTGSPDDNAEYNWYRKQFAKLGIDLNIRATLLNYFQDKVQRGEVQMFSWGWQADYPDPENFLFLLYGPDGKVKFGGENSSNYANADADRLFEDIAALPDGTLRQEKIDSFLQIVRQEGPWVWGFNPIVFTLSQSWMMPNKPNAMANNRLKYLSLDSALREKLRKQWNRPIVWPIALLLILLSALIVPLAVTYWTREHRPNVRKF